MAQIAPEGPVYQAGTLSGNPLAMAAGVATVQTLSEPGFYDRLEQKAESFASELKILAEKYLPGETTLNRVGSMMTTFFTKEPVVDFKSAMNSDTELYGQFFREMLTRGIWLAPSQFEAAFISDAQSEKDLSQALEMTEWSFKKIRK
jgi:glutamate-1-semialdehyde 2,1-aminomutase